MEKKLIKIYKFLKINELDKALNGFTASLRLQQAQAQRSQRIFVL